MARVCEGVICGGGIGRGVCAYHGVEREESCVVPVVAVRFRLWTVQAAIECVRHRN